MSNAQGSHRAVRGGFGRRKPAPSDVAPSDVPTSGGAASEFAPTGSATAGGAPTSGVVPAPRAVLSEVSRPEVSRPEAAPPEVAPPKVSLPRPAASPEALRRLVPQALVVAFLAGGTSAFVVHDKAVKLTVDGGGPRTLHTFAGEVEELLAHEGVSVGAHDIVAPAPGAELANGDDVVVRYGRPVLLTLDGHRRQVWTTARTVEGALRRLGVRAEGAFLSVSRSAAISRSGLALDVRTERTVTFMADGREHTIRTNAATVAEALARAGLALHGQDTTSVPPDTFPRDGSTITVMRITAGERVRDEPIPYDTVRTGDPGLFRGTEVVDQQGRPGARRVTYALRTVNGVKEKPRKIHEEVVRRAVTQRVRVGTKTAPASVSGADGLNWAGLAACESGGRPGAVDASGNYGGLYQFDTGTWHALGGGGRPQDAPAAEQTYRAKKLYVQRGASPWPHCGRRLTG
ncbi:cell wall-binding protein [Streptomyces sp. L-9-10]|uniref:resuscitation-promoting factor n=1 Tax=Streptomyces sp. L-9-10 TaxID=1478131 RepID=UPI0010E430A6|nr:cell wall-binding protein [Streptomyces sp. L-9-10]